MRVYDYGEYKALSKDPRFRKILRAINDTWTETKVPYFISGGLAVYLYLKNPPEDHPDIDVLLGDASGGTTFIESLRKKPKFSLVLLDTGNDGHQFATFMYDGEIQIDILTDPETEKYLCERKPTVRSSVRLEPVEPLIIEKIIRGTPSDIMMIMDLMAAGKYDRKILYQMAADYKSTGRLALIERTVRSYLRGHGTRADMRKVAERIGR